MGPGPEQEREGPKARTLMPVAHNGEYALVASIGGAPANPSWYGNLVADQTVMIQDGATPHEFVAREVDGDERELWWDRAVAAYPSYADYQENTSRVIPVFVATRTDSLGEGS